MMKRSKLKVLDARQEPGTRKKDVCVCVCVCVFCISEALESHVSKEKKNKSKIQGGLS